MTTSTFNVLAVIALSALTFIFSSCKDDAVTPQPNPEAEVLTANAGPDITVSVLEVATLDGSASKSSLNKPINYKWRIVRKPDGSTPVLLQDEASKASFTAFFPGEYEIELTISNTSGQHADRLLVNAVALQPVTLNQHITVDTRLPDRIPNSDEPDYIVPKDIAVSARLQLDPGVVIAFASDVRMDINDGGTIEALGVADNKVTFTGVQNTKGFWKGIVIYSNSNLNTFEHAEILYAGSKNTLSVYKAGLTLFGISAAQVSLKNTLIAESDGFGLHAAAGSIIREFSQNTFSNNSQAGIYLHGTNVKSLDKKSVFTSGNGRNVVEVMASIINNAFQAPETWPGFDDKTPYRLAGDLTINIGLELKPGVTVEAANNVTIEINGNGYIQAKGTLADPITITGAVKTPGYWKGIRSYSKSPLNELEYAEVSFGGSTPIVSNKKANIAVTGSSSTMLIRNSKIGHSGGYGVFVGYTSQINADVLTANTFEGNTQGAIQNDN